MCTGLLAPATAYNCSCQTGFFLPSNTGQNCVAINNCTVSNGGCSHNCIFTGNGTNNCSCNYGYSQLGSACIPINPCQKSNGGCQHLCIPSGAYNNASCFCNSGYALASDNQSCTVVNNICQLNNGGCSHICNLTNNTAICTCISGYSLANDNKSCSLLIAAS